MLRKFLLLIWKNMLLRRRHWIVTTFEVLLPTICAAILAYSNKQIFAATEESLIGNFDDSSPSIIEIKETIFETLSEDVNHQALLFKLLKNDSNYFCDNDGCPYTPSNNHTDHVMREMKQYLLSRGITCSFFPVQSEDGIEELIVKNGVLSKNMFDAAFVFQKGFPVSGNKHEKSVSYKIRMKYKYSPLIYALTGQPIMPVDDTQNLYPNEVLDPTTPNGKAQKTSYIESGFIGFQIAVDQALIKVWTGISISSSISIQPFPIPSHTKWEEKKTISYLFHAMVLPTFLVLGFIFIVPSIMLGVVNEKETGIRELLKMNGIPGWLQWIGWLANSVIIFTLSVTIVIVLLFIDIIRYGDPGVWYFFLVLYMVSASSFCFFLSSFFVRPVLATIVGIVIWLVSYFPVFVIFELYSERLTLTQKLWACLSPNVAFYLSVKTMMSFERDGVGAQWNNIKTPVNPGHYFSLGYIILMFCVNITLYMMLTFYLENILATEFGVRRPFYYIFLPSTWNFKCDNIELKFWKKHTVTPEFVTPDSTPGHENPPSSFEPEPTNIPVGIRVLNLSKVYDRNKVAVENVNLKMFQGEIFVLLGHNGAGKTTLISMLTGMCSPSRGTAEVNGVDINRQLEKVRQNLGLCPQFNMLFDKLTVNEHLIFFGRLKGVSGKETNLNRATLLRKLQLWEKQNSLARHLSGGQKRKLHLGIALIGQPGVVILDEPSSGMDPKARRAIWDVLLEMRGKRTILLTTHFMEEADVLGDRIAIMSSGKVQCCGTSSFLKSYYGGGYTLKLTLTLSAQNKDEESTNTNLELPLQATASVLSSRLTGNLNTQKILAFVQKHVPDAFLKKIQSANTSEMFITLPTETATTVALTNLFSDLPQEKNNLGIETIGMSHTTIDEVFLRVGELADADIAVQPEEEEVSSSHHHDTQPFLKLILIQFMALLLKKILYTYRRRKLIMAQIIVPVILLMGAILLCNDFFTPSGHPLPVRIKLSSYNKPIVPVYTDTESTFHDIQSIVGSSVERAFPKLKQSMVDVLLKAANRSMKQYNNDYIIAAEVHTDDFKTMYNTHPNHAAPLAINLVSNAILKELEPKANYRIQVTNHPFRADVKLILGSTKPEFHHVFYATVVFEVFMPIGLALLAATFIVLPMEEKICKAKQLQMMTIVNPLIYWGSAFIWDFFIVIVVICMMICCFPIFQSHVMYTSYGGSWAAFLILAVYGYCAIFFSYLMSHFAHTVHGGFAFVTIIHIISGLIIGIVVAALDILEVFTINSNTRTFLQTIGRLFPTYGAVISTARYVEGAIDNGRCNMLTAVAKKQICDNPLNLLNSPSEWEYLECCEFCHLIVDALDLMPTDSKFRSLYNVIPECFVPTPYIQWKNLRKSVHNKNIFVPGIAQELTYMLIMSLVYQFLLFAMEYRNFICGILKRIRKGTGFENLFAQMVASTDGNDQDVLEEAQRIKQIIATGQYYDENALIVLDLQKTFGVFTAVQQVSFGVRHGECFGLLGVNGAGKTTTFLLLTGDETPTSGVVYALQRSLKQNRRKYLSTIGYCPQFDGIIGVLTGREMLQLFCRLRGISGTQCNLEADRWLKKMGLYENGMVMCSKYSGGMKRRLCAAIAMIGDPPILLMDEPTSGVDPVSRRQFWKVLQSVRDSGQAIVLTSHSMDECEALCSRLAIMVNGKLQCIGGVQHLKSKFAQGYSLSLKIKFPLSVDSEEFQPLNEQIMNGFQPCIVKDKHNNFIQYEIKNVSLSWYFIFKTMEELKEIHKEVIEDYSVSETTLEEVFLSFAKRQYPRAEL